MKQLLIKQREEGRTGHHIIKWIFFDTNSYTITLMADLAVQKILLTFVVLEIQNIKYRLFRRIKILHSMLKIPSVVQPY